jgi:hypothetical protein
VLSPRTFSLPVSFQEHDEFESFAKHSLLFSSPRDVFTLLDDRCMQASGVCPVGNAYFLTDADIAALIVNSEWEHLLLYLKAVYEFVLAPNMREGGVVVAPYDCALFRFFTLDRSCEAGDTFNLTDLLPFNLRPFRLGLRVSSDGRLATLLVGASLRWLRRTHDDMPLVQLISLMFDGARDLDQYSLVILRQSSANHLHKWRDLKQAMHSRAAALGNHQAPPSPTSTATSNSRKRKIVDETHAV